MQHRLTSIELLPQSVVEKIAAGEVIERPASVLKELVENSIDAGATRIDIELLDAGFSLIKVADNGTGMGALDLEKSLLRHATSKIRTADDLFAIGTMGFRGEALASVAAVSRLLLVSSNNREGLGNTLTCDGGTRSKVTPAGHAQGTTIEVRDLFYNVPARKKFMKTRRSEQLASLRIMEQLVIPFPSIQFSMEIDGKMALDVPVADSPRARIAAVGGYEFAKELIECKNSREGMEAFVYVSSPEKRFERPRFQCLYVNLRRIDNDSVLYATREAFAQYLGAHFRPAFFCFLDIDPSRIDVNVHPTKQQIKFDDEKSIFSFIFSAVKQGIGSKAVTRADVHDVGVIEPTMSVESFQEGLWNRAKERTESLFNGSGAMENSTNSLGMPPKEQFQGSDGGEKYFESRDGETILPFPISGKINEKEIDRGKENTIQLSQDRSEQEWDLISCYQVHESYILAPIKNGILLIDQHAAHERVLFEQALEDIKQGRSASQQLLFPVVVELSPMEKSVVESGRDFFVAFGFEIGDFGGNAVSISAIPFFLKSGSVEETVLSMVRFLLEEKDRDILFDPEKRFAAAFACGAAIKAGQQLSHEEMNALLNSLFAAKNPYTCPHGRPTLVRISMDELQRRFLR